MLFSMKRIYNRRKTEKKQTEYLNIDWVRKADCLWFNSSVSKFWDKCLRGEGSWGKYFWDQHLWKVKARLALWQMLNVEQYCSCNRFLNKYSGDSWGWDGLQRHPNWDKGDGLLTSQSITLLCYWIWLLPGRESNL